MDIRLEFMQRTVDSAERRNGTIETSEGTDNFPMTQKQMVSGEPAGEIQGRGKREGV